MKRSVIERNLPGVGSPNREELKGAGAAWRLQLLIRLRKLCGGISNAVEPFTRGLRKQGGRKRMIVDSV
jgi:hypothetical protein